MSSVVLLCVILTLGQMNAEFYHDFRPGGKLAPVLVPLRVGLLGTVTTENGVRCIPSKRKSAFSPLSHRW